MINDSKSIFEIRKNTPLQNSLPTLCKQYIEFCSSFSLKQLISSPTRVTCNSSTIIDHILTNRANNVSQSGVIDFGISDHNIIFFTRKIKKIKLNQHTYIKYRSFKNYSVNEYEEKLKQANFPNYLNFDNMDAAYCSFLKILMNVIDSLAPSKERRIKGRTQEWFDGEISELISIRNQQYKKFKKTLLHVDKEIFKETKYKVIKMIKNKKKLYFEKKLQENIGKPKELWKAIKSLGLPSKNAAVSNICLKDKNGTLNFEDSSNANTFKSFFENLANDLVLKLPKAPNIYTLTKTLSYYRKLGLTSNSFNLSPISEEDMRKYLINLSPNKASGIGNLSGKFLKDGANVLALPISQLCNLSISLNTFPQDCKISKLKPQYKKGSRTEPKNFRPISLLPLLSKLIEKTIHDQVQNYCNKNNIFFAFQSGFRGKHSTDTCLTYLHDKILKGFDEGLLTGMIAIDLQKAFDTIDHEILLSKMPLLGFSENSIKWFRSYLSNRTFHVSLNSYMSSAGKIICGVPQGSILGPLLFLLYINDMPQAVESDLFLYADDSGLALQHKDINIMNQQLNKDFHNLCLWFIDNKLSIHFGEDKTKCILFASKQKIKRAGKLEISFNNIKIKQYSSLTYLGCILDNTLSGEAMATKTIKKINARLKFLHRKNDFLTPELRRLLCNALIQPHFDYVCSSWFPNLNQKLKKKLQITQNKCIRFCLQLSARTRLTFEHHKKINWLPIKERVDQSILSHVFKSLNNNGPVYMKDLFVTASQSNICTRQAYSRLVQPLRKTNMGLNSISYLGPSLWNKLPENIKQSSSLNSFKHKVKELFFSKTRKMIIIK